MRLLFNGLQGFSRVVATHKWILGRNSTGHGLWTSDNPVWRYNDEELGMLGNLGFASPSIQVYFPLSPDYLLLVCDPEKFSHLPSLMEMNDEMVTFANCGQVIHSVRYVFGVADDFQMAEEYLAQNPQCKDPDRLRISVDAHFPFVSIKHIG
jgi:hypothetical protein